MKNSIVVVKTDKKGKFIDVELFTVLTKAIENRNLVDGYGKVAEEIRKEEMYLDDKTSKKFNWLYIQIEPTKSDYVKRKSAKEQ